VHGKENVLSKYSSRVYVRLEEEERVANVSGGQHQEAELHAECQIQGAERAVTPAV
jgi:hypothetical protein